MEIKTSRLFIRNLRESDWADMKSIFSDFGGSRYAVYDRPFPTEDREIKALVKRFADSNLFFAARESDRGKIIGYVCFHHNGDRYDLGCCFHSAYHSKGYAYESAKALTEYVARNYNARLLTAGTAIDNQPSCRLLERLGFVLVSVETVSFDPSFSFQSGNYELTLE